MSHSLRSHSMPALGPHGFFRLAYAERGDPANTEAVVCVHGLTRQARDFDAVADSLSDRFRVACPDVPGRGRSDWLATKEDYGYSLYLSVMAALIARLGVERVDWIGTSMGGLIGMMIAAQPNSPIRRLVLNDIGPFMAKDSLTRIGRYVGSDPRFGTLAEAETYLRQVHAPFGALSDGEWRALAEHSVRRLDGGGFALHYDPAIGAPFATTPLEDVDLWPIWERVTCPVLVLRGADSDVLSTDTARRMAETGPRARAVEIPGCGHAPSLTTADQIGVVADFLAGPWRG